MIPKINTLKPIATTHNPISFSNAQVKKKEASKIHARNLHLPKPIKRHFFLLVQMHVRTYSVLFYPGTVELTVEPFSLLSV